jgi:hypothetical protein
MIGKLTLQYNRARQAAITTELMEIISARSLLKVKTFSNKYMRLGRRRIRFHESKHR